MNTDIKGDVAMLESETREAIAAPRERLFRRIRKHIASLDVHVAHVARTGATLCEVTVRTAHRVQILARHRDQDALTAAKMALEKARRQASRIVNRPSGARGDLSVFAC
jgi:ribosome-associated translation inhibitor RaiA